MATGEPDGFGMLNGYMYGGALGASQQYSFQNAYNAQNMMATNSTVTFSDVFYNGNYHQLSNLPFQQVAQAISSVTPEPVKKKVMRAIESLRAEISAWHGDILERCPA